MNRAIINLTALKHNLGAVNGWLVGHGATWSVVTKVLCGHSDTIRALQLMGVHSIGDSRLQNLRNIERVFEDFETWYLRLPTLSVAAEVAKATDVSLNSEIRVIHALDEESRKLGRRHRIIIMIELGDLREGILPGALLDFYRDVFELENIEVLGIGANLGCLAGAIPNIDQFMQLALYRELLELKFHHKMPVISAGSSAVLPLVLDGTLPKAINHFRVGEALFLGTDLVNGGLLPGLRNDVVTLESEIAEIKEKNLVPLGETSNIQPFQNAQAHEDDFSPGQRGYRALVTVGQLDTDVSGLTPICPGYHIAGASSDLTVVNLGDNPQNLKVGSRIQFTLNYAALLRLMSGKYVEKVMAPSWDEFKQQISDDQHPVLPAVATNTEGAQ